jgi:hypothetical protein
MPLTCDACLKVLVDDRVTRDEVAEHSVVSPEKYVEIDEVLGRVHADLEFRSRIGLAKLLHRAQTWFRFHGPWLPVLPAPAKAAPPSSTKDSYVYAAQLCEFLSLRSWADEIHVEACESHRELLRELVRIGAR